MAFGLDMGQLLLTDVLRRRLGCLEYLQLELKELDVIDELVFPGGGPFVEGKWLCWHNVPPVFFRGGLDRRSCLHFCVH